MKDSIEFENPTQGESFEAAINRYYFGKPYHRGCDVGPYDTDQMVKDLSKNLSKSRQDFANSISGHGRKLYWNNLLFDFGNGLFWKVTVKNSTYDMNRGTDPQYSVTVTANSPEEAASEIKKIAERYRKDAKMMETPSFLLFRETQRDPDIIPVSDRYNLNDRLLALTYGDDIEDWIKEAKEIFMESGVSIFRGRPGTGKTSFLRYLICRFFDTHRFYYVPVESFGILHSGSLVDRMREENRLYPQAGKVIVLEDAESVLAERLEETNATSSLLNLTDGLMSDVVDIHIICTINTGKSKIDEAVLRPGRGKLYKDFDYLDIKRARLLAKELNIELGEEKDYSLAEIYNAGEMAHESQDRSIGFS